MPVQTIVCPECKGSGYIVTEFPEFKVELRTTASTGASPEIRLKKKRISCPRCKGLGVVETVIPHFIPENLKKWVNV